MNIDNLGQKKWYVLDSETKGKYSHHNPIKKTNRIESLLLL